MLTFVPDFTTLITIPVLLTHRKYMYFFYSPNKNDYFFIKQLLLFSGGKCLRIDGFGNMTFV